MFASDKWSVCVKQWNLCSLTSIFIHWNVLLGCTDFVKNLFYLVYWEESLNLLRAWVTGLVPHYWQSFASVPSAQAFTSLRPAANIHWDGSWLRQPSTSEQRLSSFGLLLFNTCVNRAGSRHWSSLNCHSIDSTKLKWFPNCVPEMMISNNLWQMAELYLSCNQVSLLIQVDQLFDEQPELKEQKLQCIQDERWGHPNTSS